MSDTRTLTSRRRFLRNAGAGAAALPLAGLLRVPAAAAAELPKVELEDPTARALGYVHESVTAGQLCSNCNFWQGGAAEWGPCTLFPGKAVAGKGWCKSWIKKA